MFRPRWRAPRSEPAQPKRRRGHLLPIVALIAVLAPTLYVAYVHNNDLDRQLAQERNASLQQFRSEVEAARRHLSSEIDRMDELIAGIVAFAARSDESNHLTVTTYLETTGAMQRFASLIDTVTFTQTAITPSLPREDLRTDGLKLGLDPAAQSADHEEPPVSQTSLAALTGELRARAFGLQEPRPFVGLYELRELPVITVTFPLEVRPYASGWASLVFSAETFLARALPPGHDLVTDLIFTGRPSAGSAGAEPASGDPNQTITTVVTDNGRLSADIALDVFGAEVILESTAPEPVPAGTDRGEVWALVAAGTALAVAVFLALRTLENARTHAIETARSADRDRVAMGRRLRASFELSPIGMAEIDRTGRLVEVNPALCRQTGRSRDELLLRPLSMLVQESDRPTHITRLESLLTGEIDAVTGEHRLDRPDGRTVWINESISAISPKDGPQTWLVQCQDITAQRQAAWELAQQALHDDLTGLPNRALFLNRLKHALVRAGREDTHVAVMFLDIDRFKVINDSLGHDMGDEFLVQIANRVGTALRSGDTVARFGGDEFVVLCEAIGSESEAWAAAQRIQRTFAEPFLLRDNPTYATASIGMTISSPGEASADDLLRDADAAMYRAKESGRNRVELFDHSMRSAILARMEIESQLRNALDNGEIVMHYQAIVDPVSHEPVGYEALIRWNHPEKGLLGPAAFLPVAEEAGLIHLIDSFALRATCQEIARWSERYPAARDLYVATNWSARHLGRFLQEVEHVLAETVIDPRQLVIEVTEGFLLEDTEGSLAALARLKEMRVQIAIDDFGTGYSSLSYLTRFAVDYLKIDKSFVAKLPDDRASAAVIGAIADMANRLGIALVAEGVETEEQIQMLASLGMPRMQGYRFAKPRPASDIEHQLQARTIASSPAPDSASRTARQVSATN